MQHPRILCASLVRKAVILMLALLSAIAGPIAVARHHSRAAPTDGVPGRFDYYLLTLSWSPSYCLVHPGDRHQCQGRGFGFVLHGLWPQFDTGGYPQECTAGVSLDGAAEGAGSTLYPSPKLMRHEWERHGTCSGLSPVEYFRTADRALAAVHIPSMFQAPRADQQLPPDQVLAAFHAANPAFPPHAMTVACNRDALSEVRICLARDLQPRTCGRGVRDSCPSVPISIRAAR